LSGAIGFSVLLFIPLRGEKLPFPTWHFLNNFDQVFSYITHKEYGFKLFSRELPEIADYLTAIFLRFAVEWTPVLLALG